MPPMLDYIFPIVISSAYLSRHNSLQISITRMQVMILVREATSCEFLL